MTLASSSHNSPITSATLTTPGTFVVGCNYWASHAGTNMWKDWRPEVVAQDFQRLAEAGVQVLRIFPLWPDFQPLTALRTFGGGIQQFGFGDEALPTDACGRAGVYPEAMAHFAEYLSLAEEHGLKCIVGLLTGWMSGRLYVPPALESLNVLSDPRAIMWELRFIRYFVGQFRDNPAVIAWDLGNECNCMAEVTHEQAYTWSATIANAIRVADPTRPVVSGMHSLVPQGVWRMQDQGEVTDLLTTHPYPMFTPHCDQDPINTIRTLLHGTAESRYYADLGEQPVLCQEIGTLGPVNASESIAADFARVGLFSLWAHDCHGMLWWCANEQTALAHPPYDWCACERELGLLRVDGSAKPVLQTMGDFRQFLESLPFASLPLRRTEAVCILTREQDQWATAYSSFILAKQAGFDLQFLYHEQPLPQADLYLLPNVSGMHNIYRRELLEILQRVESGATLYISLNDALLPTFSALTGLEPQTRERRRDFSPITLDGLPGMPLLPQGGSYKVNLRQQGATVLGHEADGNPAFSFITHGAGRIYFLNTPLELTLATTPGAFYSETALPCWRVYLEIARQVLATRAIHKTDPLLNITEHDLADDKRLLIAINASPSPLSDLCFAGDDWALGQVYRGEVATAGLGIQVQIPANDAAVFVMSCEYSTQRSRETKEHKG